MNSPLLLLFWHWINPIKPKGLLNSERYIIVGAFIAAAIISPSPDALSQTIIAVPIIIIYQFGVIVVLLSIRKARKLERKAAKEAAQVRQPLENEEPRSVVVAPRPVVASLVAHQQAAVVKPQQARRRIMSLDGMSAPSRVSAVPIVKPQKLIIAAVSPAVKNAPRSQPQLQVPRRQPLISDFGPIRGYSIDTGR